MGFKKKNIASTFLPQKKKLQQPIVKNSTKDIFEKTNRAIREGLENPYASTGTPIDELKGGAKFMAQLSNIGGGSVETGGGGIKEGFNTVANNVQARTKLKVEIEQQTKRAIGKKKK